MIRKGDTIVIDMTPPIQPLEPSSGHLSNTTSEAKLQKNYHVLDLTASSHPGLRQSDDSATEAGRYP